MPLKIEPPGAKTNYRHARCFAAADANCSTKISSEHYISEVLLRQLELNRTAKIAGLHWQEPKTFAIVPLKGLASNILCDRHNSALSPLDAVAGAFSQSIADFDRALRPDAPDVAKEQRHCCGDDLERWMLKCLIGMSASKNISGMLKPECVDLLYGRTPWPDGWGLYWLHDRSATKYHSDSIAIETAIDPNSHIVLLAKFLIRGMSLGLCFGKPDQPQQFGVSRPSALVFRTPGRERHIILEWSARATGTPIVLDRAGSYDGAPPDWHDWERDT